MIGSNLAILTLAVVVAPQIEGSDNLQRSLTITTLTLVVVGLALYLFAFFTSEERVERGVATVTLRETVTTVRQNKALVVLCLSSLAFLVGMFSLQTVAIYYARDVLGDSSYYIVLTVVQAAGTFAGALLFPRVVGVIGKKYTYISAGVVAIVGGIGSPWLPPRSRR